MGELRYFFSYARKDTEFVRKLATELRAVGINLWLDQLDILGGQRWDRAIEEALETSEGLIVVLSPKSLASDNVMDEVSYALKMRKLVVPIVYEHCDIPFRLQRINHIDFTVSYDTGFSQLLRALHVEHSSSAPDTPIVQHVQQQPRLEAHLTNSIGMQFVLIPAGEFLMGSNNGDDDEKPVHKVRISQPFYLGMFAVTQKEWLALMKSNPSKQKGGWFTPDVAFPVERVSWENVQDFIRRLNAMEGGTKYRLPTEAEWEYACRAGSTTVYSFGDDDSKLHQYGWYEDIEFGVEAIFKMFWGYAHHPVGQLKPNAWGLYDMHGNISEWVQDWYREYAPGPVTDPQGPASGTRRVVRGGCCGKSKRFCQSAARTHAEPGLREERLGFRLLMEAR